ncbi:DNA polymerase III subunit delta [bacterium]|nr:DNA polymerase III subunit delta [bacterium]
MATGSGMPLAPLSNDLEKDKRPYYLFTGEQSWIVDEAVSLLRARLETDPNTGFEYRRLEIRTRWEDLETLLRNYSFFDGPKLVHFEVPGVISVDLKDSLNSFLEESPGPSILCITAPNLTHLIAAKNRIGKAKGLALKFTALKGKALEDWTRAALRSKDLEFHPQVPGMLVDRLPPDPGDIAAEVEKLALVVGPGGRLETAQVEKLVAVHADLDIFRLTDNLLPGREKQLLQTLSDLLDSGKLEPPALMGLLASNLSQVLKARALMDMGLPQGAILDRMGGHPFANRKAMERAGKSSRREILALILNLQKLDAKLRRVKKSQGRMLMESTLLEALSGHILSS